MTEDSHEPEPAVPKPQAAVQPGLFNRHMRYPNAYAWLLLFSAIDVMLTWTIFHFGGAEVNPIADHVIDRWGLNGMVVYKFTLITVFILICEGVGALRERAGWKLSRLSVAIAAVPCVWSLVLLLNYTLAN